MALRIVGSEQLPVPVGRLELPRGLPHCGLNAVRLPFHHTGSLAGRPGLEPGWKALEAILFPEGDLYRRDDWSRTSHLLDPNQATHRRVYIPMVAPSRAHETRPQLRSDPVPVRPSGLEPLISTVSRWCLPSWPRPHCPGIVSAPGGIYLGAPRRGLEPLHRRS